MNRSSAVTAWVKFLLWAASGAGVGLVLAGAFTVYSVVGLVVAAGAAVAAALVAGSTFSAIGVVPGLGVWALVIGFLNISGPGDVCTQSQSGVTCTQQWPPAPFWVIGAALILVPVLAFAGHQRRRAAITVR